MAQGKAWNQDEVMERLKPYFLLDYDYTKACNLAQFPVATLKTWIQNDPELHLKITAWRGMASAKARNNIVSAIEKGDMEMSRWWVERRERKSFSTRNEVANEEIEHMPLSDKTKKLMEKYGE